MREKIIFNVDYGTKENSSIIKVIGVGGGGGNAVRHMYTDGIVGVDFLICNTDRQALENNHVPSKLVLGESGLGAGANPELARELALSSKDKIKNFLGEETKMLFITAGMGKGTGTGAAPVVAEIAKEMGILTIAVVTFPFDFEGAVRKELATKGIEELKKHVDSLLVIKNQNIMKFYSDATLSTGFGFADDVLKNAVKCIAELITVHADQNVDFNDIETIMKNSGEAMLGLAEAEGEDRINEVVEKVFTCPLINDGNIITNAKNFLFFVSYGKEEELRISELDLLTQKFDDHKNKNSTVIWGRAMDESLGKSVKLSLIITNFMTNEELEPEYTESVVDTNDIFSTPETPFGQSPNYRREDDDPFNQHLQKPMESSSNIFIPHNKDMQQPLNERIMDNKQPQNLTNISDFGNHRSTPKMIRNMSADNNGPSFDQLYLEPAVKRAEQAENNTQTATMTYSQPNLQIEDDSLDFFFKHIPD